MYAIVDIETTGSYAAGNGIIEVSIQVFDGENVIEKFESLVNPGQKIPRYIQAFTGITNEMVTDAPYFEEIAEKVYTILQGNIFVAHNVNFDYSFVKNHLQLYGYTLNTKKLCTVRLSRQIFPGYPSYSLGNLCHSLGIDLENRHRAGGDAAATVTLFKLLLQNDTNDHITASLKRNSKEQTLPPNVPKAHFDALPSTPGVYYFHDSKGKVVYVGKAKDIKKRVNSHFSNNSDSKQKQNFVRHVHAISFQATATELMAAILESTEIKRLWPSFNNAQKKPEDVYGIFVYEDQAGYMRLAIEKKRKNSNPIYTFHYKVDGHGVIRKLMKEFDLCPKLCFMQTDNDDCQGMIENHCHGACEKKEAPKAYNDRVLQAIASLTSRPSYIVLDKGLNDEEVSCIMVVKGSFFGMGYLPKNFDTITEEAIAEYIKPYKENSYIRTLLNTYINNFPDQIKHLPG
ncbi:exonuclease domain-containing protein [Flavisolibacter tropicus]|uniref:DNA polymerase III subunit epsilon n=1 Tax=Flavisolibacter tropicus TaxID=1492898 RepID=A0A172U101_9BACT|nr:exonuclease domain-containing protein [Flavisolibacter tropicus]ANE52858.1 DNA polymerase III subunit epsilon [Flavisolibacter tropicus]